MCGGTGPPLALRPISRAVFDHGGKMVLDAAKRWIPDVFALPGRLQRDENLLDLTVKDPSGATAHLSECAGHVIRFYDEVLGYKPDLDDWFLLKLVYNFGVGFRMGEYKGNPRCVVFGTGDKIFENGALDPDLYVFYNTIPSLIYHHYC